VSLQAILRERLTAVDSSPGSAPAGEYAKAGNLAPGGKPFGPVNVYLPQEQRMTAFRRVTLTVALVLGLAACAEKRDFRTRLVREWPADEISEVKLRGINGTVRVQAHSEDKITLVAEIRATGRPAREAVHRGLIETTVSGETLSIRERTFSKKIIEFIPFFNTGRVRISYSLKVPESTVVRVNTVNGRIETEGVSGFLNLETINGPIRVSTPRAQLDASTVNGSIRAVFTDEFRGAQLKTVNGSIRLSVPAEASIDAQVEQVNGSFKTNMPVRVSSTPGSRETSGSINGGEFPLEVSTVNGSVSLERREAAPPADEKTEAKVTLGR
jgi:hypothetical protein